MLSRLRCLFRRAPSFESVDRIIRNATPQFLITNRDLARSIRQPGGGGYLQRDAPKDNLLSSLYRLYFFITTDDTIGLRNELEFFFNKAEWAVNEIPDPQDTNPQRYAILAVMPALMVRAFNRLISKGLPRNAPAIIDDFEALAEQPRVLEEVPAWVHKVPKLDTPLSIPNEKDVFVEGPEDPSACREFLEKGI